MQTKVSATKLQVQALGNAVSLYKLDTGRYPTQEEGLEALIDAPPTVLHWNGPYVQKKESLVDPWGYPYHYKVPGGRKEFEIYSLGADNAVGGTGENQDISN